MLSKRSEHGLMLLGGDRLCRSGTQAALFSLRGDLSQGSRVIYITCEVRQIDKSKSQMILIA